MAHVPHFLPDLVQVSDKVQFGDDTVGTVIESSSAGVLKAIMQDYVTLARVKLAAGVDADDAVAFSQHTALDARVGAIETLLTSDDVNLDEAQEWVDFMKQNSTDISALSTSLNAAVAAVQADVDQNEVDSDAAEAALDVRATALEAFETLFKNAITVTADGADWDIYLDKDLYINSGALLVGNATIISAGRELKNIAALDAGTDTVVSATGKAYTDVLAAKHAVRYKNIAHTDAGAAAFGTSVDSGLSVLRLYIRVNTAFDAGATLDIGHATDAGYFGSLSAANLAQAGVYEIAVARKMATTEQPRFTLSGSPSVGDCEVFLEVTA